MLRLCVALVAIAAALSLAGPASGSALLARNAKNVKLEVNDKGMALITYRDRTGLHRVLAWNAVNARLNFKLDYSGGFGAFKKPIWKTFKDASTPYDGPSLHWLVTARKAPDGSYWALQSWQRQLPNYGVAPWKPEQMVSELRLSHWTGEVPKLEIWLDWVFRGRAHHLFGRYTYQGKPVFGFKSTPAGVPLDPFGRNIYVDTFNSAYGPGWKRENSFLTHRPNGNFCYGFFEHTPPAGYPDRTRRPKGHGERYRATVIGPGVAPDAYWEGAGLGEYDQALEDELNALSDEVAGGDSQCRQH